MPQNRLLSLSSVIPSDCHFLTHSNPSKDPFLGHRIPSVVLRAFGVVPAVCSKKLSPWVNQIWITWCLSILGLYVSLSRTSCSFCQNSSGVTLLGNSSLIPFGIFCSFLLARVCTELKCYFHKSRKNCRCSEITHYRGAETHTYHYRQLMLKDSYCLKTSRTYWVIQIHRRNEFVNFVVFL